jgi:ribonucleotide reductase beta subunit family protein with ferritin-like domain
MSEEILANKWGVSAPFDFNAKTQIMTPTASYARCYPKIVEIANKQLEKQFWTASEMKVELDRMQLLYDLAPEQLHAVKFVLQLFLKYELIVGEEFWQGMVAALFPRPEVKLACSVMGMTELAIHAEFYNDINVQLGLDTDEHYLAFANDPVLAERVAYLEALIEDEDKLGGMIIFGLTETALLFSSFAILKSHQCNGNNKIPVIVRGTNQSAIDEDLHGVLACEIINTHYQELGRPLSEDKVRVAKLRKAIEYVYEHECRIIDLAIPGGRLNGQTAQDYKDYVKVRINEYCARLGLEPHFKNVESTIRDWFETATYSYKMIDFFSAGMGMEYETAWDEHGFILGYTEGKN